MIKRINQRARNRHWPVDGPWLVARGGGTSSIPPASPRTCPSLCRAMLQLSWFLFTLLCVAHTGEPAPICRSSNITKVFYKKNSKTSSSTVSGWLMNPNNVQIDDEAENSVQFGFGFDRARMTEGFAFDPRCAPVLEAAKFLLVISLRRPINRTISFFYSDLPGRRCAGLCSNANAGSSAHALQWAQFLDAWPRGAPEHSVARSRLHSRKGNTTRHRPNTTNWLRPVTEYTPNYFVRLLSARCANVDDALAARHARHPTDEQTEAVVRACLTGCGGDRNAPVNMTTLDAVDKMLGQYFEVVFQESLNDTEQLSVRLGRSPNSLAVYATEHRIQKGRRHSQSQQRRRMISQAEQGATPRRRLMHASIAGGDTLLPPGITERLLAENAMDEELYRRARELAKGRGELWRETCASS